MRFPVENNPQSNVTRGMQSGMDMYSKLLQMIALPEMMKTEQETKKAGLLQQQLANQYYPQTTESDIGYKNALTGEANERLRLMPIDNLLKQQQAYNEAGRLAQSQDRFTSTLSVLQKFLSSDVGKNLYANDKDFANAATNIMRGIATEPDLAIVNQKLPSNLNQNNYANNLQKNLLPEFAKNIGFPFSQNNQENINQGNFSVPGGVSPPLQKVETIQREAIKTENPYLAPSESIINDSLKNASPDVVKEVQNKIKDIQEKRATTTATLNQRQYANIFNALFEQARTALPAIYEYSGVKGHAKLLRDRALAAAGIYTAPNLVTYTQFEEVTKPTMSSELRRKLGNQATDQEINKMMNVVDPSTSWFSNKEIAQGKFEALEKASKAADTALMKGSTESKEALGSSKIENNKTNNKFPTKTVNGKVMVQSPNGKWYSADEL